MRFAHDQRRALYHDPDILVMDAIHNLMHTKTIILIAHRITTVRECDLICLMERGRIVACGRYDELLRSNERFRAKVPVAG